MNRTTAAAHAWCRSSITQDIFCDSKYSKINGISNYWLHHHIDGLSHLWQNRSPDELCLRPKRPILSFLPPNIWPISIEPKWRWRRFAENICWDSKRCSRLMVLQLRIGSSPLSYHSSHKVLAKFYVHVVVINQIYQISFINKSTPLVHLFLAINPLAASSILWSFASKWTLGLNQHKWSSSQSNGVFRELLLPN